MKTKKAQARLVEILVILLIVTVVALYVAVPRLIKSARQVENITDIGQFGIGGEDEEQTPIIPIERPIDLSSDCNRENLQEETNRVVDETNIYSKTSRYLEIVRCHRDISQVEEYSTQDIWNYLDSVSALMDLADDTPSLQMEVIEEIHSVVESLSEWQFQRYILRLYYEKDYKDNDFIIAKYIEIYNEKIESNEDLFIQSGDKYIVELIIIRWYMEEFNFIQSVQITTEEKIERLSEIHSDLELFYERHNQVLDERSKDRFTQLLNSMQLKIDEYRSSIQRS